MLLPANTFLGCAMQTLVLALQTLSDVAFVGLAAWMFFMVRPQIRNLKSLVEAKQGQIDIVEADRDRWKAMAAPALAAEHQAMKGVAEEMAKQKHGLEKLLEEEKAQAEKRLYYGIGFGCFEGALRLSALQMFYSQAAKNPFLMLNFSEYLEQEKDILLGEGKKALSGNKPDLAHLNKTMRTGQN